MLLYSLNGRMGDRFVVIESKLLQRGEEDDLIRDFKSSNIKPSSVSKGFVLQKQACLNNATMD